MSTLYLIRHGEPAISGIFLGSTDPELSDEGRSNARHRLGSLDVRVVYSSPLQRAYQTAELVPCENPIIVIPELREMSFGEWEGLTWNEIETRYPLVAENKLHAWMAVTPPGGETWNELAGRARDAVEQIRAGLFPAAVVAHMVVNSGIAHLLDGADPRTFYQGYCEVIRYEL